APHGHYSRGNLLLRQLACVTKPSVATPALPTAASTLFPFPVLFRSQQVHKRELLTRETMRHSEKELASISSQDCDCILSVKTYVESILCRVKGFEVLMFTTDSQQ
ncbi:hypothetical protein C5167_039730, partial [Papaver somniferum]